MPYLPISSSDHRSRAGGCTPLFVDPMAALLSSRWAGGQIRGINRSEGTMRNRGNRADYGIRGDKGGWESGYGVVGARSYLWSCSFFNARSNLLTRRCLGPSS